MTAKSSGFWRRVWKQPRQLWVRRAFFQIHLWCGIALALYVVAIGISGSILVFKDELMPRPTVEHRAFDPANCTPERLVAALNTAEQAHPEMTPSLANCPMAANALYTVTLHPRGGGAVAARSLTIFVHPESGLAVGEADQAKTWVSVIETFHVDLLLKKNGRVWNGLGAAALLALVLSGLVIWWPGIRRIRRALMVNLRLSWRRINFDLHSAAGIWTVFFTLLWAVSGLYFAWETPFYKAITAVSPIVTAQYPADELARLAASLPRSTGQPIDLLETLSNARSASPQAQLEGLFFGSGDQALLTVYMARGDVGDYTKTDFLYCDQHTGKLLYAWHRGANQTLGDWLLWLLVPLHFGTSWGLAGKIAWCALGLVLPLLVITGLIMYWNRWLGKRLRIGSRTPRV